jgi:hypothetical protein
MEQDEVMRIMRAAQAVRIGNNLAFNDQTKMRLSTKIFIAFWVIMFLIGSSYYQ